MRVFPDANFLVAAGLRAHGDYRQTLVKSRDEFVTSEHVLSEVARNLARLNCEHATFIDMLRGSMQVTDQFDLLPVGLPLAGSGDRQALAEAIGAGCDMFVTSDMDFAPLFGMQVKGVLVEKSAVYVRRVLSSNNL